MKRFTATCLAGDRAADIALVGGTTFNNTQPVAISNSDGTFTLVNEALR